MSEDPDFAEICAGNGLHFIGPRPEVLSTLGDKAHACAVMADAGLPTLPGGHHVYEDGAAAARPSSRSS